MFFAALPIPTGLGPFSASRADNQTFFPSVATQWSDTLAIGAASSNRRVVAVIALWSNFSNILSVSIGGVPAVIHVQGLLGDSWTIVASAIVPAGTTASVVVNFDPAGDFFIERIICQTYRLVNALNAAPTAQIFTNPSTRVASGTINIPDGGCLIAFASEFCSTGGTKAFNWVGATEYYDAVLDAFMTASAAFDASLAAQTGRTVSATYTGTGSAPVTGIVAVSWR